MLQTIHQISGITLILSLIFLFFAILCRIKIIINYFKKIPKSLIGINLGLALWGLFFIPKNFSSRDDFGVWFFSESKLPAWGRLLSNIRAPVYYWRTKLLNELFGGVSYEVIANLNFISFIMGSFLIYILVKNIIQNNKAAYAASLFFIINPILFTFNLTEDYAILALFFALLALFFASIQIDSGDNLFLILAMSSALLAAGARIEYIFFPFLLILFYFLFIFKKQNNNKFNLVGLLLFFILMVPRIISTMSMYFGDMGTDPGLNKTITTYKGDPIKYFFKILKSNYGYFGQNLKEAIGLLTNPYDLTLLFFILGLTSLFLLRKKRNAKLKKAIIFFLSSFFFLILFYNYLHTEVGMDAYRYMITIFTPLIISAGIGFGVFLKNKPIIFYFGLHLIFIFSFITCIFPLAVKDNTNLMIDTHLKASTKYNYEDTRREYNKYKKLTYENKITNLLNVKDLNVTTGEKTYFITNGTRNLLLAMPINGSFLPMNTKEDIANLLQRLNEKNISSKDKIYISQSEMGFTSNQIDNYAHVNPEVFEKEMKDIFNIKREIISYNENDHHAFLYEVTKK